MRFFRESPANTFTEVVGDVTSGAIRVPFGNLAVWSDAERLAVGIYGIAEPVAPSGQIVSDWHVARVNGTVQAVATYASAPLPHLSFLEFMALFTPAEQAAIVDSADTNVRLFLAQSTGADFIDLGDARLSAGLAYLVGLGILASGRPGQILNNMAPA